MTINGIIAASDFYTDENISSVMALEFCNTAIALINNECDLSLPNFIDSITDYTALKENWIRGIVLPYLNYGVKANDTSINEYRDYQAEFREGLAKFKNSPNGAAIISDEFKSGDFGGIYGMDTSEAIDRSFFDSSSRGNF
jgi:hypothetical protein